MIKDFPSMPSWMDKNAYTLEKDAIQKLDAALEAIAKLKRSGYLNENNALELRRLLAHYTDDILQKDPLPKSVHLVGMHGLTHFLMEYRVKK